MKDEFGEIEIDGVQFRYRVRDGWCCWSSDWVKAHDLPQLEVRYAGSGLERSGEFHLINIPRSES